MAYTEEKFKTRLERNARCSELNETHSGVVIWSNPVKIGFDDKTQKSIYETEWIVAYPEQLIETVEQLQREFCLSCGAGIGAFRRKGEGTCPECDPAIGKSTGGQ